MPYAIQTIYPSAFQNKFYPCAVQNILYPKPSNDLSLCCAKYLSLCHTKYIGLCHSIILSDLFKTSINVIHKFKTYVINID